jgi:hypothetical protein
MPPASCSPNEIRLVVMQGDGIGPEITAATLAVLQLVAYYRARPLPGKFRSSGEGWRDRARSRMLRVSDAGPASTTGSAARTSTILPRPVTAMSVWV